MSDYGLKQYLGGIMGDAQGAVTITKCHNSGDVLSDQETCNASEVNLGGIMGGIYNPEKWECKISDTDNTGHITEKQHSISRIGGIIADGRWPNLTLQNTANYGNLQYAVNDDYAEAEIGGILGQGCEAEESDKSTWNALQKQDADIARERKSQVGSGDRSEKIRTYNFPQGRVTDHRIGLTLYRIDAVLDGELDELIDALVTADQAGKLKNGGGEP